MAVIKLGLIAVITGANWILSLTKTVVVVEVVVVVVVVEVVVATVVVGIATHDTDAMTSGDIESDDLNPFPVNPLLHEQRNAVAVSVQSALMSQL